MADDSTRTVLVALGAGLGVALAKVGAAVFTGSPAMAAEASHSLSAVFDPVSFRQSAGQMIHRGRRYSRGLIDESKVTSDPALRAVFLEDAVSVSGNVVALAALALNQITGSSIPQGVAAVLIGLVLIRVSLRLIKRSHDFLVGAWLLPPATAPRTAGDDFTQPLRTADEDQIRTFLLGYPGVTAIREVLVTFTGPGKVWVTARLDIDDGLTGAQVKALVRGIEWGMKRESEAVYRVDVVPMGLS